jgi:hypothetical protein
VTAGGPERFYPDTNVVHRLRQWPPAEFDRRARAAGVILHLGFHVIYELFRGLVTAERPESRAEVQAAGSFLAELEVIDFNPTVDNLLRRDFHRAVTGLELVTVVDPLSRVSLRQELFALGAGNSARADLFIRDREDRTLLAHREVAEGNARAFRDLLTTRDPALRRLRRSFAAFREHFRSNDDAMLRDVAKQHNVELTAPAVRAIVSAPERYPVVSTFLLVQWHLAWVVASQGAPPAIDKRDDLRHLIESATSDLFVTADGDLERVAPEISPYRPVMGWRDFAGRLG